MSRLMRIVPVVMVLVAPFGTAVADGQVQVSVRADIDIMDAASVLALSAKIGNVEIKARTGWAGMAVTQRQAFVQAHPTCPPTVVNKDWTAMTVVERGELLRCQPDTRVVLVEQWDRSTDDDRDQFLKKHPEARRRLEKVHGKGWHGGSHGRGNDGTRSDDGKGKDHDQDEGKGKGKGHGKDKGR